MAVSQEIFRANLTIETQVADAIGDLQKLQSAIADTVSALKSIENVSIRIDTANIDDFTNVMRSATNEIKDEFERLRHDVVGGSIIPDMLNEIKSEFATLPDKTRPEVFKLKDQFRELEKTARDSMRAISDGTTDSAMDYQNFAEHVMRASGMFKESSMEEAFANVRDKIKDADTATEQITQTLSQFKQQVQEVGQTTEQELGDRARELVSNLGIEMNRVGQVGIEQGLRPSLKNFTHGLALARAEGGNMALGLRQAFFGVRDSSNVVAKALDFVADRTGDASAATNRYAKEAERLASIAERETRSIANQAQVLKDIGAELNVPRGEVNRFEGSVVELRREFGKLFTTIEAGGAPTAQQLSRVRLAARGSLQEISLLRQRLGDTAPPEVLHALDQLEERINSQAKRAELATANAKAYQEQTKKLANEQSRAGKEGEQHSGILDRIRISFSNLFNITRNVKNETHNTTNEFKDLGNEVKHTSSVMGTAKGAFLGFVGAAAAITGIRYMFDGLRFAIAGVGREILEVNSTMQNFGISVEQQLQGSELASLGLIENVQKAVSDFILEVGAKTPFETIELFESIPILVASGLDPKRWLGPMADLAAAMNKPFEQVQYALQKLVAGETGDAIRQFRDMGLVMQNVKTYVNAASGELLSFDDAQAAAKMSAEELAAAGIEELGLEFKKSGQLATDAGTALQVINGYLKQSPIFYGAAEARSRSFSGVMSNLKDNVNSLYLAMGQPVIEAFTNAGARLLETMNKNMPVLERLASTIGIGLTNAFRSAVSFIENFNERFNSVITTVQDVIAIISSIFAGNWQDAWVIFLSAIDNGVSQSQVIFDNLASSAFTWGYNFIVEVANGIIDSVGSVLVDALNYVGDTMASFMAPGSPPKEGPLSTIDEWGSELMDVFGASVEEIDTGSLARALEDMDQLMDHTGQQLPQSFIEGFKDIDYEAAIKDARDKFRSMMGTFGQYDMSGILGGLAPGDFDFIRSALDPVKDFLKETVGKEGFQPFMKVRDTMAAIVSELNETGEVNEELFGKISGVLGEHNKQLVTFLRAQLELQAAQKKVSEAEARGFVPAELKAELAAAEEKVAKEQEMMEWQEESKSLQDEFLGGLDKAASAMAKASKAAGKATAARVKEFQTLADWYAKEKALIEEKYRLGILSEEEYTKALLQLEKQYVDRALEEGVPAGLQAHIDAINELESKLGGFKTAVEDAATGIEIPTPEDIYAGFLDNVDKASNTIGETFGDGFMNAFQRAVPRTIPQIMDSIWTKISAGFTNIFNRIRAWLEQNVTPQNFPFIALVAGILAQLGTTPILGFLGRLASLLGSVTGASGGLVPVLWRLVTVVGKFSLIGAAITLIFLNWDEIISVIGPVVTELMGILSEFANTVLASVIEQLGGMESASQRFGAAFQTITDIIAGISGFVIELPELVFSGDFQQIGANLLELIKTSFDSVKENVLPLFMDIFLGIGDAIKAALPPEIVTAIENVRLAIAGFFEQGRLGGELVLLFQDLGPAMEAIGTVVGPVLAVALGAIIDIILSLAQTIGDILPYIEGILAGIVRVIRGVITTIEGIAQVIIGIFLLLTGKTDEAHAMLLDGLGNIVGGFTTAFSGLVLIVENALAGVVAAVISFVSHLFENVNLVTGLFGSEPLKWIESIGQFRINALAAIKQFTDDFREFVVGLVGGVIGFFRDLKEKLIGGSIIPEMITAILAAVLGLKDGFVGMIEELVLSVAQQAVKFIEIGTAFVSNIKQGISNAWQGLQEFVTGKVEALFGPILDVMSKIPGLLDSGELKEAGANMVGGVKDGIEGAWNPVQSFFSNKAQELQEPVEETKQGILGIFGNMQQQLVGGSIVPETTMQIEMSFRNMNTKLKTGLNSFMMWALNAWRRFTNQMVNLWRNMVSTIISLAYEMEQILRSVLMAIVELFYEWEKAISAVIEKMEMLPGLLQQVGEMAPQIANVAEEFHRLLEECERVSDTLDNIIDQLKEIAEMGADPGHVSYTSGPAPGAQTGLWRVPRTSTWTLHAGETVLPPDVAAIFRSLMTSIRSTGIGNADLGIPAFGSPAVANNISETSNQYMFGEGAFAGAFPNVTDGRDAGDFLQSLDEFTSRGTLRGAVVG